MRPTMILCALFLMMTGLPLVIPAAETPPSVGPDVIKLKMGDKTLSFQHRKHQLFAKNDCSQCHKPQEWKIKEWNKEVAHQICISCHDLNDKGPVDCKGCHTAG